MISAHVNEWPQLKKCTREKIVHYARERREKWHMHTHAHTHAYTSRQAEKQIKTHTDKQTET